MKQQVRSFIAIEISSQIRNGIARYLKRHITNENDVKWVPQDQFHLTLKFLGDVPMNEMHQVIAGIEKACRETDPFDLVFEGIGAFPNDHLPRTLWVGVSEGIEESRILAEQIDLELERLGFPREPRRFTPHLTIGRVKQAGDRYPRRDRTVQEVQENSDTGLGAFLALEKEPPFFGISSVDGVTLFSSELSRSGPKYDVLAEIDLHTVEE